MNSMKLSESMPSGVDREFLGGKLLDAGKRVH